MILLYEKKIAKDPENINSKPTLPLKKGNTI